MWLSEQHVAGSLNTEARTILLQTLVKQGQPSKCLVLQHCCCNACILINVSCIVIMLARKRIMAQQVAESMFDPVEETPGMGSSFTPVGPEHWDARLSD